MDTTASRRPVGVAEWSRYRHDVLIAPIRRHAALETVLADELRFRPAEPVTGVRHVRVETRDSPSWVS